MKSVSNKIKETMTVGIAIGLVASGALAVTPPERQDHDAERPGVSQREQPGQPQRQQPGQRVGERTATPQRDAQQGDALHQSLPIARATKLLDMEVHGQDGEKLGDVEEIILSQDRRSVEFIKVDLDEGDSVKVSLDDLSAKQEEDDVLVMGSAQPGLQQRQPQDRSQVRGQEQAQDRSPARGQEQAVSRGQDRDRGRIGRQQDEQEESRWVSKLIGMDLQGSDGEDVGSINDLIIDTESGQIKSAAIEIGGILGLGASLASVEWQQVNFAADGETASINMTEDQLSQSAQRTSEYWERHERESTQGQRERALQQRRGQDTQSGQRQRTPGVDQPRTDGPTPGQEDNQRLPQKTEVDREVY